MYSYLYLTTRVDALRIIESGYLLPSKVDGSVYAIDAGGEWVPSVQHPSVGGVAVAPEVAVLFESCESPTFRYPEEVVWRGAYDANNYCYQPRGIPLEICNATLLSLGAVELLLS